jgi:hypothetical protein
LQFDERPMKGGPDYNKMADDVSSFLEARGFLFIGANPAKIGTTQLGVKKCNQPANASNSWNSIYYQLDKDELNKNAPYSGHKLH